MSAQIVLPDLLMEIAVRGINVKQPNPCPPPVAGALEERHHLRQAVNRISSATVIDVRGEVDACNAHEIVEYAVCHLGHSSQLLLDLSEVDFQHARSFRAL